MKYMKYLLYIVVSLAIGFASVSAVHSNELSVEEDESVEVASVFCTMFPKLCSGTTTTQGGGGGGTEPPKPD